MKEKHSNPSRRFYNFLLPIHRKIKKNTGNFIENSIIPPKQLYLCDFQSVIDGDICEQFSLMDSSKQKEVAEELGKSVSEVSDLNILEKKT